MEQHDIFVGIDIAKKDFAVNIYLPGKEPTKAPCKYSNSTAGVNKLLGWIAGRFKGRALFCMEDTGSYSETVAKALGDAGLAVWVEHPQRIKASFGTDLGKDDDLDAKRIAEYAWRYRDHFRQYEAPSAEAEEIRALLSVRQLLIREKVAHVNELKDMRCRATPPTMAIKHIESMIQELELREAEIRGEIEALLPKSGETGQACASVRSIPGVGLLMTASLAVYTNGFRNIPDGRRLAAYMGVCPRTYVSGTSVKRKPRSVGYGPNTLRVLFFMACCVIKRRPGFLRNYALRKEAEGKPKMLVLNSMRNKLAHLICALIRTKTQYIDGYKSIEPRLAMKMA
jgi:transposase